MRTKAAVTLDDGDWIWVGLETPLQVKSVALPLFNTGHCFVITYQLIYPLWILEGQQIELADQQDYRPTSGA